MTLGPRGLQLHPTRSLTPGLANKKNTQGSEGDERLGHCQPGPSGPVLHGAPIWASTPVSPDVTWKKARGLLPADPPGSLILRLGHKGWGSPPPLHTYSPHSSTPTPGEDLEDLSLPSTEAPVRRNQRGPRAAPPDARGGAERFPCDLEARGLGSAPPAGTGRPLARGSLAWGDTVRPLASGIPLPPWGPGQGPSRGRAVHV